eukprot:TRINITY_DN14128_c0_g1_i2.p1 TRINITY_DN14128_c0_g1~~TRINITY_DN14128_c0_g1_i2.p1  ORF type:complete len:306 (+),score=25.59 TRINITY_DN14128_c0_g1_i2:86-919(+)
MDIPETPFRVAGYLPIRDVAKWQMVNASTKQSLDAEGVKNVWKYCVESEFEDLYVADVLFERRDRRGFLRFLILLGRTNFALDAPLFIGSVNEVSFLDNRARKAADACKAHFAASGRDAHSLLGEFDLHNPIRSTMFSFGVGGKAPLAGLPTGVLKIKLVLDGNALWSWAEYLVGEDEDDLTPCGQAQSVHFTLSIDSADSDIVLRYRAVPFVLDRRWRSTTSGVCCNRTSRRLSARDTNRATPTMCAVSLLQGALPEDDDVSLMNALNLDACLRTA